MQYQSLLVAVSLVMELDLSSWIMWAAQETRQTLIIALTLELVSTTVFMVKMQE